MLVFSDVEKLVCQNPLHSFDLLVLASQIEPDPVPHTIGFGYNAPGFQKYPLVFLHLRQRFGFLRGSHNRQVEGLGGPVKSFWAHHLIDSYRFLIELNTRPSRQWGQRTGSGPDGHSPHLLSTITQEYDMLTASKLEKIIELEENLKAQYQAQLDAKTAEIEGSRTKLEELQATVAKQLETITELSAKASANQKLEQQNRELHNRSENMKEDVATQKQRSKTLQKELGEARDQIKALTQYDAAKMKKNLDDNKKRLAEKTSANEALQKSLSQTRKEKAELEQKVKELETRLAELEPKEEVAAEESEAA
jgi:hypothetical protein